MKKLQSHFYGEVKKKELLESSVRALYCSKCFSLAMKFLADKTKLRLKRIYDRSRFWQKPTALDAVYIYRQQRPSSKNRLKKSGVTSIVGKPCFIYDMINHIRGHSYKTKLN
jgi:hypothetical protein